MAGKTNMVDGDNRKITNAGFHSPPAAKSCEREESINSAAFFEGHNYDDFDDFAIDNSGGIATKSQKMTRRHDNRGGNGGTNTIYSAKHVRAKERQRKGSK